MDFSRLKYISTDAPTTDELELLNGSRVRIAQVIQARRIILGTLEAYGIFPFGNISGPADRFTDIALDAQYQFMGTIEPEQMEGMLPITTRSMRWFGT